MPRIGKSAISAAASAMSRMRKTFAGGRPAKMRTCPRCRQEMTTRELHRHNSQCPGEPVAAPPVGRPKKLKPCPHCKKQMGARELKAHKPICPKRK